MRNISWIWQGAVAGIIAGIVFTFFLVHAGMLTTLGNIINLPNTEGGLLVHAVVSIGSGIAFALVLGWLINSWTSAVVLGVLFGFALWVGGPMTILPALSSGVSLFAKWTIEGIKQNVPALVGHIVFGVVLGISYFMLKQKTK
ncbi:hypothetical protein Lgra_2433 [Legionella gratiana]|uniref:Transmembrane protein n=1 Tax=Legionella gratiana TaxID=45066 RepID=A0A378JDL2_9GAMM|nr:hypothetical protein [Legionella gratiana]KTD09198.1 hypothetical protein Lgra_2433 [Legionella gratiana]STX45549.1 Uncharacterised protein [Legionella gratiana]